MLICSYHLCGNYGSARINTYILTTLASDLAPVERALRLTTPKLIIVGEDSPASVHEVASQLREAIPNALYNQLADQDHMPNPNALLPVLTDFLQQ